MFPYLRLSLLIMILIAPAACKEVAYVYSEGGSRVLQDINLTAHEGSEVVAYAVSLGEGSSPSANKIKNTSADSIKDDLGKKVNQLNREVIKEGRRLTGNLSGDRRIDQICSIYEYLVSNWVYNADWKGQEYFQYSNESLEYGKDVGKGGKGDCDDFSILLAALIESVGGTPRVVFAYGPQGGHAYAQVYIGQDIGYDSKASRMIEWLKSEYGEVYAIKDDITEDVWLNLDWWKDPKASKDVKHPGGPLFNASDFVLAYSDNDRDKWTSLTPVPEPPQARFFASNVNPNAMENVTFDASKSIDADTEIKAWNWDFEDGEKGKGRSVVHSYTHGGRYNVTLTVADDDEVEKSSQSTQTIEVNGLPIPVIDYAPKDPQLMNEIYFDASQSRDSDPGGSIKKYSWAFDDGETSVRRHPSPHKYETNGNYTIRLEVEDDKGARNATSIRIKVNLPPNALFEYSPMMPILLQNVTFNAISSKDNDGNISDYFWDFGDNSTTKGIVAYHNYSQRGNYTVRLKIKDSDNASSNISVPIRIIHPPIAMFDHSPENPEVDETVVFNASDSIGIDGKIIKYIWDFYDGYNPDPLDISETPKKFYSSMKTKVTLKVIDSNAVENSTTKYVMISDRPGHPKILSFEAVPNNITSEQSTILSWSVLNAKTLIITPEIGIGTIPSNGSRTISPRDATTYTMVALNEADQADKATTNVNITDKVGSNDFAPSRTMSSIKEEIARKVQPGDRMVREMALDLAMKYPGDLSINQICAIYDDINGNWAYISDPLGLDVFQYANETIKLGMTRGYAGVGDSDDFAILMASLIESIGGTSRIIFAYSPAGGHAFSEVYLGNIESDDLKKISKWLRLKYNVSVVNTHNNMETGDVWLNLDWFGDHPGGPFYQATNQTPMYVGPAKHPVAPATEPPVAVFTYTPDSPNPGDVVVFDASSSHSSAKIEKYYWDFGDGLSADGSISVTHSYLESGIFGVNLTTVDKNGEKGFNYSLIKVNMPPVPKFSYIPKDPNPGEYISFNASQSTDKDGAITGFDWDFGDNSTANGSALVHHVFDEGTFLVKLTINDDNGAVGFVTYAINIYNKYSPATIPSLYGIWIFQGVEKYGIFLALNQSLNETWEGRAKYEGDGSVPWNADVKGNVNLSSRDILLVIHETDKMNITRLIGEYSKDAMRGEFIRADYRGVITKGSFNATLMSNDPSVFRPTDTGEF